MLATSFLIYITIIDPTKANKCTHEFQLEASIRKAIKQIDREGSVARASLAGT